jgi:hypothetical protein
MTNNQINTINRYFDSKHMDRRQLEAVLDFDNLTMDKKYMSEIRELFKSNENESIEDIIKGYVHFVKSRSDSGVITWDEFMTRLDVLALEYSDFGIRVQRFSKPAYWEIFFNHFDITDHEDGDVKLTFNQKWYEDAETEIAYEFLSDQGINMDAENDNIMSQVAAKWDKLADDEKDNIISALNTIYVTHYVDKSMIDIMKSSIKRITMSNADLVPEVGLRDYNVEFTDESFIGLRF